MSSPNDESLPQYWQTTQPMQTQASNVTNSNPLFPSIGVNSTTSPIMMHGDRLMSNAPEDRNVPAGMREGSAQPVMVPMTEEPPGPSPMDLSGPEAMVTAAQNKEIQAQQCPEINQQRPMPEKEAQRPDEQHQPLQPPATTHSHIKMEDTNQAGVPTTYFHSLQQQQEKVIVKKEEPASQPNDKSSMDMNASEGAVPRPITRAEVPEVPEKDASTKAPDVNKDEIDTVKEEMIIKGSENTTKKEKSSPEKAAPKKTSGQASSKVSAKSSSAAARPPLKRRRHVEFSIRDEKFARWMPDSPLFVALQDQERLIDACLAKKRAELQEALAVVKRDSTGPSFAPGTVRKRLRLYISDTSISNKCSKRGSDIENSTDAECSSWSLTISGRLVDSDDPASHPGGGGGEIPVTGSGERLPRLYHFTHYIRKLNMNMKFENGEMNSYSWSRHRHDRAARDSFQIRGIGSRPTFAVIGLEVERSPELWIVSKDLENLLGLDTGPLGGLYSLVFLTQKVWEYLKQRDLLKGEHKTIACLDGPLLKALGMDEKETENTTPKTADQEKNLESNLQTNADAKVSNISEKTEDNSVVVEKSFLELGHVMKKILKPAPPIRITRTINFLKDKEAMHSKVHESINNTQEETSNLREQEDERVADKQSLHAEILTHNGMVPDNSDEFKSEAASEKVEANESSKEATESHQHLNDVENVAEGSFGSVQCIDVHFELPLIVEGVSPDKIISKSGGNLRKMSEVRMLYSIYSEIQR